MGMFDRFVIEDYSLHENLKPYQKVEEYDGEWQTKSLDRGLDTYTLKSDGYLYKRNFPVGYEEFDTEVEDEIFKFHGIIDIHNYINIEYWEENKPKVCWDVVLELKFTDGKLEKVIPIMDKKEEIEKERYRRKNLLEFITEVVNPEYIVLEKKNKYNFFCFCIEKDKITEKWAIFDNRHRMTLTQKSTPLPFIPEESPLYVFDTEFDAVGALKKFIEEVQSGRWKDEDFLNE